MTFLLHALFAILLFYLINWIGHYSSTFGYTQLSILVRPDEAPAFNFLIRALSPSVFLILLAVCLYTARLDGVTVGIWKVAIYYYAFRLLFNVALARVSLINWTTFGPQAVFGTTAAYLAYRYLIVPRSPLFPNATTIGNELWIAVALFLYATTNNIRISSAGTIRRKNRYIERQFSELRRAYSKLVEGQFPERYMELVPYAVMVHENFNRPPLVRRIERLMFPRLSRTLGIMQVRAETRVSDDESVSIGVAELRRLFEETRSELVAAKTSSKAALLYGTLAKYNRDQRYVTEVMELLRVLSAQVATEYRAGYQDVW